MEDNNLSIDVEVDTSVKTSKTDLLSINDNLSNINKTITTIIAPVAESKVEVIDALMGKGKTTWAFDYMNEHSTQKFIFVTPYLEQAERLLMSDIDDIDLIPEVLKQKQAYHNKTDEDSVQSLYVPKPWQKYSELHKLRRFRTPVDMGEGKLNSLHSLLVHDFNIVTTHALFKICTEETIDLIRNGNYTLILDESLDVFDMYQIGHKDYEMLLNYNIMEHDDEDNINWLDEDYDGKFNDLKTFCHNGDVVRIKSTTNIELLIWSFNKDMFNCFNKVFILTYIFEANLLKYYFEKHDIKYQKHTIENYKLVHQDDMSPINKEEYKKLIHIYDGNLNMVGDRYYALSLNWFKKKSSMRQILKNNLYNYYRHVAKANSETFIWTCFKSQKENLEKKGYKTSFVSCNIKATNKYQDKSVIAYCCNRFISPDYKAYFDKSNIIMDEEAYALSEMLQFIWRGGVRQGKPIYLYIPSSRMRALLIDWLNREDI